MIRYLAALPALFAAGFLWQLGRDSARRVIIRRTKDRTQRVLALRRRQQARRPASMLLYVADPRETQWTVQ